MQTGRTWTYSGFRHAKNQPPLTKSPPTTATAHLWLPPSLRVSSFSPPGRQQPVWKKASSAFFPTGWLFHSPCLSLPFFTPAPPVFDWSCGGDAGAFAAVFFNRVFFGREQYYSWRDTTGWRSTLVRWRRQLVGQHKHKRPTPWRRTWSRPLPAPSTSQAHHPVSATPYHATPCHAIPCHVSYHTIP